MVAAIRQNVTVQAGGLIEIRSPELHQGERAEVIVLVEQAADRSSGSPANWRRFAGAINSGNPQASDNEQIDADLGRAYGAENEPRG